MRCSKCQRGVHTLSGSFCRNIVNTCNCLRSGTVLKEGFFAVGSLDRIVEGLIPVGSLDRIVDHGTFWKVEVFLARL